MTSSMKKSSDTPPLIATRRPRQGLMQKLAAAPHVLWAILFVIAPLIFVAYFSFSDANGSFTLENFSSLLSYKDAFLRSISYSLIATLICFLIGYPLAYTISNARPGHQKMLIMLVMLPMWINFLIRTYAIMKLLEDTGIINSILMKLTGGAIDPLHMINTPGAVILGMVYNFLPYMIMPIYSVMAKLDYSMVEACQDLGGNRLTVIRKCIIPMSMPGVVSGVTMVFVPSISTFYISQKLGGGVFDLLGDTIERQFQNAVTYHTGAAISLVMMVLILISLAIMNKFSDKGEDIII